MSAYVVTAVAVVAILAVVEYLLPSDRRRWWRRLGRRARAARESWSGPALEAADPFAVLRVQERLGALAGEIRVLEGDPDVFARGRRLQVAQAAYDDLLDEACRLAGVPVTSDRVDAVSRRWREEQELAARGWTW